MKPGSVLVTGAAGFISSHLCDRLRDGGCTVLALDNLSTGDAAHLAHLRGNPCGTSEPINIGNPLEHTMLELAEQVLLLTGSRSRVEHHPLPADDPARRRPDVTRAQREPKWQPRVTLQAGLQHTIDYFRAQPALAAA